MIPHRIVSRVEILALVIAAILWRGNASASPPASAYIANQGDDTVSVLSLNTREVAATIGVGDGPVSVAVTADGSFAYVVNSISNDVSVIDTRARAVIKTVAVGTTPARAVVSRDGGEVYVTNSGSASISVIDTATNQVIETVATTANPNGIAVHPVRDEVWFGNTTLPAVLQVRSTDDFAVLATTTHNSRNYASWDIEFRPDGSEAFGVEGCGECGRFHRISGDLSGGTINILQQDILAGGGFAIGLAINPVNGIVYLAKHDGPPRIVEFGGQGRTLTFTTQVRDVVASPDGSLLLVSHQADPGFVSVIDADEFTVLETVEVGAFPERMAVISQTCEPVEEPDVRGQGFWKRVCEKPHPSGEHENLPGYVDCVNATQTFADVEGVDGLCDRLNPDPKDDKCEQAEAQFMALLLNVCSGRVARCNCVEDPVLGDTTVGEVIDFIDFLLSDPDSTREDCALAQSLADDINNGVSLVPCP